MKLGEVEFLGWLAKREDLRYGDFVRPKTPLNRYGGIAYAFAKAVRTSLGEEINNDDALGYIRKRLDECIDAKAIEIAREKVPELRFDYEHQERLLEFQRNIESETLRGDITPVIDGETVESIGRSSAFLAYCEKKVA